MLCKKYLGANIKGAIIIKKRLVILLGKLLSFVGKLLGKGSSMPGKIALRLYPEILTKIRYRGKIIAVTGSNGKTTTIEMLAKALRDCGYTVAYNKEGANQTEGVTTSILRLCTFGGELPHDFLLMESDERYLKRTFKFIKPDILVVTNLYRDQLTRNGNPEFIFDCIAEGIPSDAHLILNADDPLSSLLAKFGKSVSYFGISEKASACDTFKTAYNDGAYCPNCKAPLSYDYRIFAHLGGYHCDNCGHHTEEKAYEITSYDTERGEVAVNGKYRFELTFNSLITAYNSLAAFSAAVYAGCDAETVASSLNHYVLTAGRVKSFTIGGIAGTLLTSKHENSMAYNTSFAYAAGYTKPFAIIVIVDAISRKYFTSDTSWLYDLDFERLNVPNLTQLVLAGNYCYDLALRMQFSDLPAEKIKVLEKISDIPSVISSDAEHVFIATCFSDRDKVNAIAEVKG